MAKIDYQRIASSLICYGFSYVTREMCLFVLGEVIKNPVVLKNNWSDDERLNFNMFDYVDFDGTVFKFRKGFDLNTKTGSLEQRNIPLKDKLHVSSNLVNHFQQLDFCPIV